MSEVVLVTRLGNGYEKPRFPSGHSLDRYKDNSFYSGMARGTVCFIFAPSSIRKPCFQQACSCRKGLLGGFEDAMITRMCIASLIRDERLKDDFLERRLDRRILVLGVGGCFDWHVCTRAYASRTFHVSRRLLLGCKGAS